MAKINCSCCNKMADTRSMHNCRACNAYMCQDCYDLYSGYCNDCQQSLDMYD